MVADTHIMFISEESTWRRRWHSRRPSLSDCLPNRAPPSYVLFTAFKPTLKAMVSLYTSVYKKLIKRIKT